MELRDETSMTESQEHTTPVSKHVDYMQISQPIMTDDLGRVAMTVRCRDCDSIPKVKNAGGVFTEGSHTVQFMHNGVRVVAGGYHGDWMKQIIHDLKGHHEPQEERVFYEILKHISSDATMIELGGFWSYYSLWFLKDQPQRRSIVVEPDPNNLKIGKKNAELNSAPIHFVHGSVGEKTQPPSPFRTETAGFLDVPQVCVSDLLGGLNIGTLDILHCDTQGAEIAVIRSCETLFRSGRIKFGVFSTHSHHITGDPLTHQRCLQMLNQFGAQILAEHDVHESFSGDGLIAAYFGNEPLAWEEPAISLNRYSTSLFRNLAYDLAERL